MWAVVLTLVVIILLVIIIYLALIHVGNKKLLNPTDEEIWIPYGEYKDVYLTRDDILFFRPRCNSIHCWWFQQSLRRRYAPPPPLSGGRDRAWTGEYTCNGNPCRSRSELCRCPHQNCREVERELWSRQREIVDKPPPSETKVILYLHGNFGNITHKGYIVDTANRLGLDLLLVDYSGFGRSSGEASIQNCYRDADTAYRMLNRYYSTDHIIIWGESMGGPLAIRIAASHPCDRLVLHSTFSSLASVLKHNKMMPEALAGMAGSMMDLENEHLMKRIRCPTVILHSENDSLVTYENALRSFKLLKHTNKAIIKIHGDHSSPEISMTKMERLARFIDIDFDNDDIGRISRELSSITERENKLPVWR